MDLGSGERPGSWKVPRSSPAVRSWIPNPLFLYRQLKTFFNPVPCSCTYCSEASDTCHPKVPIRKTGVSDQSDDDDDHSDALSTVSSAPLTSSNPLSKVTVIRTDTNFAKQELKTRFTSPSEVFSSCHEHSHQVRRNVAAGPCPCFLNETDPRSLRSFSPPSFPSSPSPTDPEHIRMLYNDYGVVTKQCTSLRDEVDRLEASLSLLEETRAESRTGSPSKEVRVVLYGDMGAALSDDLPKDSMSESLFTLNMNLLNRLQVERGKVEKRNEDHQAMSSQLRELVTTVGTFQAKFEEHLKESRALSLQASKTSGGAFHPALTGGTESGFGDVFSEHTSSVYRGENANDDISLSNIAIDTHFQSSDVKLTSELMSIINDLRKTANDISLRENRWIDEQKSWALFSTDVCARLSALKKLVENLNTFYASHRLSYRDAFNQLRTDYASCLSSLRHLSGLLFALVEPLRNEQRKEKHDNATPVLSAETNVLSVENTVREKVQLWQEKSCQVGRSDEEHLEDLRSDYVVLEERLQSTIARLKNSNQEKLLLDSTIEKLKDELTLAQYEKESLMKKNERTLLSLNTSLNEKSAIESALSSVSADLDNASRIRWEVESSNILMRDTMAGLNTQNDCLINENGRLGHEKDALQATVAINTLQLANLREELTMAAEHVESLQREVEEKAMLKEELACAKQDLQTVTQEMDRLQRDLEKKLDENHHLTSVASDLELARQESEGLRRMLLEKTSELSTIEETLEAERAISTILRGRLETTEGVLHDRVDQVSTLTQSIGVLEADIVLLREDKLNLESDAAVQRENSLNLARQITSQEDQLSHRAEEVAALKSAIDERYREIDSLRDKVDSVEALLRELTQANDALQLLKYDIEEALLLSKETVQQKDTEIEQLEQDLQEKLGYIWENQREIDSVRSELSHVNSDLMKLRGDYNAKSREVETANECIVELTAELAGAQQVVPQLEMSNILLRDHVKELEGHSAALVTQLEKLKEEIEVNCRKSVEDQRHHGALSEELTQLRSSLSQADELYRNLQSSHEDVTMQLDRVRRENVVLESYVGTYSELIEIFIDVMASNNPPHQDSDSVMHSPFSTVGQSFDDSTVSPEMPREFSAGENDSGFAGNSIITRHGSQIPILRINKGHTTTYAEQELGNLIHKMENENSDASSAVLNHSPALRLNLQKAHSAVKDVEYGKSYTESLVQTVQELTKSLDMQYKHREKLSDERDELKCQVAEFLEEVKALKDKLEVCIRDQRASRRELEAKDTVATELKLLLHDAEEQNSTLKRHVSASSTALNELNSNYGRMLEQKEDELSRLKEDLRLSRNALEELGKQSARHEGRLRELLNRLTTTDAQVSDLTRQLRETEARTGTADELLAKADALQGLEQTLDGKICHIQEREQSVREIEKQVSTFVTDQLELANRESEVNKQAHRLGLKASELNVQEAELNRRMNSVKQSEDKLQKLEADCLLERTMLESEKESSHKLEQVRSQQRLDTDALRQRLRDYEAQIEDLTKSFDELNHVVGNYKNEKDSLESEVNKLRSLLQNAMAEHQRLQKELDLKSAENRSSKEKLEAVKFEFNACQETLEKETIQMKKTVAERSNEVEKLRHLLQSSELKLRSSQRTFEVLEERLQTKSVGEGSLEDKFNHLNVLYADMLEKYNRLSEAFDEMEIQTVRNRDEYRDAKRELDNLMDIIRRHLNTKDGSCVVPVARENDSDRKSSTITKQMISNVRVSVEILLEERNRQTRKIESLVASQKRTPLAPRTIATPATPLPRSPGSNYTEPTVMNTFREDVFNRLYQCESRENIAREEIANLEPQSPVPPVIPPSRNGRIPADPHRRQAILRPSKEGEVRNGLNR